MKKLLFNVIGVLSKDPCAVQVSCNVTEDTVRKKKIKESQEYYLAVHLAEFSRLKSAVLQIKNSYIAFRPSPAV